MDLPYLKEGSIVIKFGQQVDQQNVAIPAWCSLIKFAQKVDQQMKLPFLHGDQK